MAAVTDYVDTNAEEARAKRVQRIYQRLNGAAGMLGVFGLGFIVPLIKLAMGDSVKQNLSELWQKLLPPDAGIQEQIDFRELAERFELTGGHIRNAIVRAAVIAFSIALGQRRSARSRAEAVSPISSMTLARMAAGAAWITSKLESATRARDIYPQ